MEAVIEFTKDVLKCIFAKRQSNRRLDYTMQSSGLHIESESIESIELY